MLGSILPLAAYRVTRAVLSGAEPASSAVSSPAASAQPPSAVPSADAETFLVEDQATGQVLELSRQEYVLGAVAAEMPVSWPDEALKAQAVAAHSYALYCRDHTTLQSGAWLTADPARRQGCLTEPVLRSYWGTAYEQNYARLSALVDEVLDEILYYENAPACASYFAISNGQTEASENVWGSALPYLISVDSSTDRSADNYEYTVTFSAEQVQQALAGLGISADLAAPEGWFGPAALTSAGYTKTVTVCGQTVSGTTLRRALGLRSTCLRYSTRAGIQLYHPGLRPRRGPEPVGHKGHGGAGQKLCRYSGTLLPRHAAARMKKRPAPQRHRPLFYSLFFLYPHHIRGDFGQRMRTAHLHGVSQLTGQLINVALHTFLAAAIHSRDERAADQHAVCTSASALNTSTPVRMPPSTRIFTPVP